MRGFEVLNICHAFCCEVAYDRFDLVGKAVDNVDWTCAFQVDSECDDSSASCSTSANDESRTL